eukprot:Gregarina_sp_Poly_1__2005@NODE_1526_length_3925_cov_91_981856_g1002_i1_p1_GENE_NODE_1526_length_3925_cov_91_981856_g1002_i1NODE_1526_length_3925_cov_91_981856_g1002_i1_p1_ORF_typecomplete_len1219_score161_06_NODE_1526_length_3925_cov_91_981856_g1002_i1773733
MDSLKRQSICQFLDNPIFAQWLRGAESKARVTAILQWARRPPYKPNTCVLSKHGQDLMRLKRELRQASRLSKGDRSLFDVVLSSLESWPVVLLLNVAMGSDVSTATNLLEPFLVQWQTSESDEAASLNLLDHLLKDFCELLVFGVSNSEGFRLGSVLRVLSAAFGSNRRLLIRMRLSLVRRVDRVHKLAMKLTDASFSGDTSKTEQILVELRDLIEHSPSTLNDSLRFLTPTVFILCHHIWSQGPSRLGSNIFLSTLELFKLWSAFVSDAPEERQKFLKILEYQTKQTLLTCDNENAYGQFVRWVRKQMDEAKEISAPPPPDGILDRLVISDLDLEWKLQGLTSATRILQVITNSETIKGWIRDERPGNLSRVALDILAIADACAYGIGKVQILEGLTQVEYSHLFYFVKWSLKILAMSQNTLGPESVPALLRAFVLPSVESSLYQSLNDLNQLDTLAIAIGSLELGAKLSQIETSLKYFGFSVSLITEGMIRAFCNFLVDHLMVDCSDFSAHTWLGLPQAAKLAPRNYLFTGKPLPPVNVLHQAVEGSSSYKETFIQENMQSLFNFPDKHLQNIWNILLFSCSEDLTFGLRNFLESLGHDESLCVYEWRHTWMNESGATYSRMGKAFFWRRRLLKWYSCYLWLRKSKILRLSKALVEGLISNAVTEILELQSQRMELDSRSEYFDSLGTLLSLESLYFLLKQFSVLSEESAIDRHLGVLAPLLLFVYVTGSAPQIETLVRILDVCQPLLTRLSTSLLAPAEVNAPPSEGNVSPSSSTVCSPLTVSETTSESSGRTEMTQPTRASHETLRLLCVRHQNRVLRVFASRIVLGNEGHTERTQLSDVHMWASLTTLIEFLDGTCLVALGHRMWEDLRWSAGLSFGCTRFLAALSCHLCQELFHFRQRRDNGDKDQPTKKEISAEDGEEGEAFPLGSLPYLGVLNSVTVSLNHDEDCDETQIAWKDWRSLADFIILKMGGVLSMSRGDGDITQSCLAGLFNALYLHTTQMRGYLSHLHNIWRYIRPLFAENVTRASDLSTCLEGMNFSMLKFAGNFFESRFHEDIEPVISRYMLEIAFNESLEVNEYQMRCILAMFSLLKMQASVMTLLHSRTHVTCLSSILIATHSKLPQRVKSAAIEYLKQLHNSGSAICRNIFSIMLSADSPTMKPCLKVTTHETETPGQIYQLLQLYHPMKSRRLSVEGLQRIVMEIKDHKETCRKSS